MVNKSAKKLERHFKGAANHYRIGIILLLEKNTGLSLEDIVAHLKGNTKTISGHTGRLVTAGLVTKRYAGRQVVHTLSPYGRRFAGFIRSFRL